MQELFAKFKRDIRKKKKEKRYQSRKFVCESLGPKGSTLPLHAITKVCAK